MILKIYFLMIMIMEIGKNLEELADTTPKESVDEGKIIDIPPMA